MSWLFTNFSNKRLEWCLALYCVWIGTGMLLPPVTLGATTFRVALQYATETGWGGTFLASGILHMFALHINGRAAWTPFLRAAALAVSSQTFLAFALSLAPVSMFGMSFLTYLFFAIVFCGVAFSSAAFDCGREIKIWRMRHGKP